MRVSEYIALFLFLLYELTEAQNKFEINVQDFQRLVSEVSRFGDVTGMQNEVIRELQTKLERQEKEMHEFKHLTRDIHEFRTKFEHQEAINRDFEARLTQQQVVIKELNAAISQQEETDHNPISKQRLPEVVAVEPETGENNRKYPAIKSQNRNASKRQAIKRQVSNTVAFFATITQPSEDNVGIHQDLVFEDIVTNIGGGYNNHHGIFIVPVSGIYLITTSVLTTQNQEYWAEVVVNAIPIARLNGHGTDGRHATGTQTLIMFLTKGDDVAVQNINNVDSFLGSKYSSFGGVLLQEYEPGQPSVIG